MDEDGQVSMSELESLLLCAKLEKGTDYEFLEDYEVSGSPYDSSGILKIVYKNDSAFDREDQNQGENLQNAGLYWKMAGSNLVYGKVKLGSGYLELEATKANKLHSVLGRHSPKIYALAYRKYEGSPDSVDNRGYIMGKLNGYKLSSVLSAVPVGGKLTFSEFSVNKESVLYTLTVKDVIEIKRQINEEIFQPLRENELLHGDMQPPNFLIVPTGPIVKLIDPWYEMKCVVNDERVISRINSELDIIINKMQSQKDPTT